MLTAPFGFENLGLHFSLDSETETFVDDDLDTDKHLLIGFFCQVPIIWPSLRNQPALTSATSVESNMDY